MNADNEIIKMTAKDKTRAFRFFARRHGFYQGTVRRMTSLRKQALTEWIEYRWQRSMEVYLSRG